MAVCPGSGGTCDLRARSGGGVDRAAKCVHWGCAGLQAATYGRSARAAFVASRGGMAAQARLRAPGDEDGQWLGAARSLVPPLGDMASEQWAAGASSKKKHGAMEREGEISVEIEHWTDYAEVKSSVLFLSTANQFQSLCKPKFSQTDETEPNCRFHLGRRGDRGCHECHQPHSIPLDDLCWLTPQVLHQANHKGEATVTLGATRRWYSPWRTCTACAPQEEQADSGTEHITYLSVQVRWAPCIEGRFRTWKWEHIILLNQI
jgi:hypothetical protein